MPEAVVAIPALWCAVRRASGRRTLGAGWQVSLIITSAGAINLDLECGYPTGRGETGRCHARGQANLAARSASGSARFDAYVVCPASGTTVGKMHPGISDNWRPEALWWR
ncbi:MAG: hypothetical protein Ct9H300mP30_3900 [Methanobacteriota archaeon]|nr:MAG: hypothetical protein Ct9H300mP30_3900 [Euryarchaeota archaeon]